MVAVASGISPARMPSTPWPRTRSISPSSPGRSPARSAPNTPTWAFSPSPSACKSSPSAFPTISGTRASTSITQGADARHLRAKDHQLEGTSAARMKRSPFINIRAGARHLGDFRRVALWRQPQGAAPEGRDRSPSSEDARDALEFTPGAIAPLAAPLVDDARCHALGIDLHGSVARPTAADVAAGTYPIVRPIVAVVVGRPTLNIRVVTEYLTGPAGPGARQEVRRLRDSTRSRSPSP